MQYSYGTHEVGIAIRIEIIIGFKNRLPNARIAKSALIMAIGMEIMKPLKTNPAASPVELANSASFVEWASQRTSPMIGTIAIQSDTI
mgnify:CR=1 FL=1